MKGFDLNIPKIQEDSIDIINDSDEIETIKFIKITSQNSEVSNYKIIFDDKIQYLCFNFNDSNRNFNYEIKEIVLQSRFAEFTPGDPHCNINENWVRDNPNIIMNSTFNPLEDESRYVLLQKIYNMKDTIDILRAEIRGFRIDLTN